ncbi:molybdate ABC transporter substrate-binding protein [Paenibacillus sp. J22TS3]|uniref:molybdate ABC transporter substrate-binding protein n=1 Tax=Paenibacillus sp. J22TS3 TaxID=2807192 RepID=UPI001B074F1F|nr:molybdate ABC transporter substrate-binding protein [Paenibacillus sp. J22TS3]GIP24139.1 molybdate ABC transporter substrate-binding protein [Paenibacillus sp. J22TS3]
MREAKVNRKLSMKRWLAAGLILLLVMLAGCGSLGASGTNEQVGSKEKQTQIELVISAAASLKDSLNELKPAFEKEHPNVRLLFNFGASGALQKQIEQGVPADVFLSAGQKQMDALIDKKLVDPGESTPMLKNDLVLIAAAGAKSPATLESLGDDGVSRIAVGEPESVPAGQYTKEALEHYKLWDKLKPKLVFAKDVRQVLTYVETGNVEAGFVYRSDAQTSTKAGVMFTIDPLSHRAIVYPEGIVKATQHPQEAKAFYNFMTSKTAQHVFTKYGFSLPDA